MREIVNSFAPLVGVSSVRAALVVGADCAGDFGAILTHAHFVTLKTEEERRRQ